jgi:hypothetical protein
MKIPVIFLVVFLLFASFQADQTKIVTVPFLLDHNRMLVDAEMQKSDGTWRKVRLWVDSGNPAFIISESLARDLGIDLSAAQDSSFKGSYLEVPNPTGLRIGGMKLNLDSVKSRVAFRPFWLFSVMHNDGNLPSTILKNYHIIFDYPKKELTIAEPNSQVPRGIKSNASIRHETGMVQLDAVIDGDSLSFALDNGASYSFISGDILLKYSNRHPDWPAITGTVGCANMWGWWPANEENFPVVRIPEFKWGEVQFKGTGMVGVPEFSPGGQTLGEWYSRKTALPVDGFIGANALRAYRVEIDYAHDLVYFEKCRDNEPNEMELAGLSLRQLPDSTWQVVGVVGRKGKPSVEGVEKGDVVESIDQLKTRGLTMGTVVDALRGKPGEIRVLSIVRDGKKMTVKAKVEHYL